MARRKFSIRISVFFTSDEYTSDPTIGQNGTCGAPLKNWDKKTPSRKMVQKNNEVGVPGIWMRALVPSSCAIPSASAVFPVPGAPANSSARPAIFFCLIMSTMRPQPSRALSCPTQPAPLGSAVPSSFRPRPLMCVCVATRARFVVLATFWRRGGA